MTPQLERIQTVEGGGNRQEGSDDGTDVLVLAAPWQTPGATLHPGGQVVSGALTGDLQKEDGGKEMSPLPAPLLPMGLIPGGRSGERGCLLNNDRS